MTIIEQARQLLASLEALSMPDTQVAALCRALIARDEALRWYGEQAEALSRYINGANPRQDEAILAVVAALHLDSGGRANRALTDDGIPREG